MKNGKSILKETLKEMIPALTFFSLVLGAGGLVDFAGNKINNQITKKYARENLENIMLEQEIALMGSGINHFGVPNIDFEYNSKDKRGGHYLCSDDKIVLNLKYKDSCVYIGSDGNKLYSECQDDNAKKVIAHELGHYYCDKLNEKLFNYGGIWNSRINRKIITEGIAEYFEHETCGKPSEFKESEWPKSYKELERLSKKKKEELIYDGGASLVKPLIDKYGRSAVECLIYNPIKDSEILNHKSYQQRIEKRINSSIKENRARSKI
jgi:hypothetical protein